jgi:hypothetical protein
MSSERIAGMRSLEGRHVGLAFRDGSRIEDCRLVSAARRGVDSLWVYYDGMDVFVPLGALADLWETAAYGSGRAA